MNSTSQANGHILDVMCEPIEVTPLMPYPDPNWRATDSNGHEHSKTCDGYPTLTWVVDYPEYAAMEDGYLEEYPEQCHYECSICGEVIVPGTTVDTFRRYIPGRMSYCLDGNPITRDEAEAFIAALPGTPT